jgi:fused signal recognition particle receptor
MNCKRSFGLIGKTTSIAKIAKMYKDQGYKVLLAAGDTFRAGAI